VETVAGRAGACRWNVRPVLAARWRGLRIGRNLAHLGSSSVGVDHNAASVGLPSRGLTTCTVDEFGTPRTRGRHRSTRTRGSSSTSTRRTRGGSWALPAVPAWAAGSSSSPRRSGVRDRREPRLRRFGEDRAVPDLGSLDGGTVPVPARGRQGVRAASSWWWPTGEDPATRPRGPGRSRRSCVNPQGLFLEVVPVKRADRRHRVPDAPGPANISVSARGVVRGSYGRPPERAKYVTCARAPSSTSSWTSRSGRLVRPVEAIRLDGVERRAVYVAEGLRHRFCALTDNATLTYLCAETYRPGHERTVDPLDRRSASTGRPRHPCCRRGRSADVAGPGDGLLPSYETCRCYAALRAGVAGPGLGWAVRVSQQPFDPPTTWSRRRSGGSAARRPR
jgi:dTDP-4-dehydrorhamnose 3,5-epimerase